MYLENDEFSLGLTFLLALCLPKNRRRSNLHPDLQEM